MDTLKNPIRTLEQLRTRLQALAQAGDEQAQAEWSVVNLALIGIEASGLAPAIPRSHGNCPICAEQIRLIPTRETTDIPVNHEHCAQVITEDGRRIQGKVLAILVRDDDTAALEVGLPSHDTTCCVPVQDAQIQITMPSQDEVKKLMEKIING